MSPLVFVLAAVVLVGAVVLARAGAGVAGEAARLRRAVHGLSELRPAVVELRTRARALREEMERRGRT